MEPDPRSPRLRAFGRTAVVVGMMCYWLGFTALAIRGGYDPGFVRYRQAFRYPAQDVILISALIAGLTFAFYKLLQLGRLRPTWWRWAASVVLALVLVLWETATLPTDRPRYVYVMPVYALTTLGVLIVSGVIAVSYAAIRRLGLFRKAV